MSDKDESLTELQKDRDVLRKIAEACGLEEFDSPFVTARATSLGHFVIPKTGQVAEIQIKVERDPDEMMNAERGQELMVMDLFGDGEDTLIEFKQETA